MQDAVITRLNDQDEPQPDTCGDGKHVHCGGDRCECGAMRYRRVRVYHGEGARARIRRLKQIAKGQLAGGVTPEARAFGRHIALTIAASEAEQACFGFVKDHDGRSDRIGMMRLYLAVHDLARFLRGEPEMLTASTSAVLGAIPGDAAPAAPHGDGERDLAA